MLTSQSLYGRRNWSRATQVYLPESEFGNEKITKKVAASQLFLESKMIQTSFIV